VAILIYSSKDKHYGGGRERESKEATSLANFSICFKTQNQKWDCGVWRAGDFVNNATTTFIQ